MYYLSKIYYYIVGVLMTIYRDIHSQIVLANLYTSYSIVLKKSK